MLKVQHGVSINSCVRGCHEHFQNIILTDHYHINTSCMQLTEDDLYLAKHFQNKYSLAHDI